MIGYLKVDLDKYLKWYDESCFYSICNLWRDHVYPYYQQEPGLRDAYEHLTQRSTYYDDWSEERIQRCRKEFDNDKHRYIRSISDTVHYMNNYGIKFSVLSEHEKFFHAKLGDKHFMFLKDSDGIEITYLKSYSYANVMLDNYMDEGLGGPTSGLLPAGYTLSIANDEMSDVIKEEKKCDERVESIHSGTSDELIDLKRKMDELQAQMKAKQDELMLEVNRVKEELELKKSELTRKIEILETKIYAIRCFTGEVINFAQLRSGSRLPVDSPLVINQKIRYLDEEMGRMCAIYDFDFSEIKYFEEFLSKNDEAVEVFCPSPKSISLVRITRDNVRFVKSAVYQNMLDAYRLYHGSCIGILIRDGEQLYIGWTEDDHISIPDDLFYTEKVRIDSVEDAHSVSISTKKEILSRYFIFNILKGCLSLMSDSNGIIQLPSGTDILKQPNPYVIFSSADGWIDSDKYEDFSSILKLCNDSTKVGDHVVCAMSIRAYGYESFENERGRGDRNITRGCGIADSSVEKINLIDNINSQAIYESDDMIENVEREYNHDTGKFERVLKREKLYRTITFENNTTKNDAVLRFQKMCDHLNIEFDEDNITWNMVDNYYISVIKDDSDYTYYDGNYKRRERESRVNFLVVKDEFINIECMNSNWLEYYITSKKTKNVRIGGKAVNYSYLIMYLNTALKHVRQREEHEMALLMEAGFRDFDKVDWLDALSRYKLRTGRHELKPRWAKQLAQELHDMVK